MDGLGNDHTKAGTWNLRWHEYDDVSMLMQLQMEPKGARHPSLLSLHPSGINSELVAANHSRAESMEKENPVHSRVCSFPVVVCTLIMSSFFFFISFCLFFSEDSVKQAMTRFPLRVNSSEMELRD